MKFPRIFPGSLPVSLLACALVSACNPDDYFEMNSLIAGDDAYCSYAKNLETCEALPHCQPAFEDLESDVETPIYSNCIANPPSPAETTTDGGDTTDDELPPTVEDAFNGNCQDLDPRYLWSQTITEKKSSGGTKKTSVTKVVKVKVCHQTGNMNAHAIVIACPALRPHVEHHDDYLGACAVEE